jgi:hypothetical protein
MPKGTRYSPELREHAVRMVFDHAHDRPSQWATIGRSPRNSNVLAVQRVRFPILVQFIGQIVGLILLRRRAPGHAVPVSNVALADSGFHWLSRWIFSSAQPTCTSALRAWNAHGRCGMLLQVSAEPNIRERAGMNTLQSSVASRCTKEHVA